MKRILVAALAVMICAAAVGCSNDSASSSASAGAEGASSAAESSANSEGASTSLPENLSIKDKTSKVLEEIEFQGMVEVVPDKLKAYFDIDEADVKEYSAYICASGAAPDEFGIFVATDDAAAKRIVSGLETRTKNQHDTFEAYTPGAMYRFDDAFIITNGNTVIYAICSNNELAKQLLS